MNEDRVIARILLVDDEPALAGVVAEALRDDGYDVVLADDVEGALACLRARPFDLLWTDLKLPGGAGLDLVPLARDRNPGLPVLLFTAYASEEDSARAQELGVTRVLSKPIRIADAIQCVRDVLTAPASAPSPAPRATPASRPVPECAGGVEGRLAAAGVPGAKAFWHAAWAGDNEVAVLVAAGPAQAVDKAADLACGAFRAEATRGAAPAQILETLNRVLFDLFDGGKGLACVCARLRLTKTAATVSVAAAGASAALAAVGEGGLQWRIVRGGAAALGEFPTDASGQGRFRLSSSSAWVLCLSEPGAAPPAANPVAALAGAWVETAVTAPGCLAALAFQAGRRPWRRERLRIQASESRLPRIIAWLEDVAARAGLGEGESYEFVSAASEAVANAVAHGYGGHPGPVELAAVIRPQELVLQVRDQGQGVQWSAVSAPADDPFRLSGRGMALMRALSDRFAIAGRPGWGALVTLAKTRN